MTAGVRKVILYFNHSKRVVLEDSRWVWFVTTAEPGDGTKHFTITGHGPSRKRRPTTKPPRKRSK